MVGGEPLRPGPLLGLASPAWSKSGDPKPESIERNMARVRGLDRPLYEQYGRYLRSVVTLDFGNTFSFRYRTVNSILKRQGLVSLELGLLALGWAFALGVPLGMVGALRAGTKVDGASRTAATVAYAVPNFLVGTILVYFVAVKWGLLRTNGWEDWRAKLLPSFTWASSRRGSARGSCARGWWRRCSWTPYARRRPRGCAARGSSPRTSCAIPSSRS